MKIIKEEIEQELSNEIKDDQYKDDTEKAKEEAEKLIDPIERKNEKIFLGATKQPEPKEPEEPKATLDESLFEDVLNELVNDPVPSNVEEIKEKCRDYIEDLVIGNQGVEDNLALVLGSKIQGYDPEWCMDVYYEHDPVLVNLEKARKLYIDALNDLMFYYIKDGKSVRQESLKESLDENDFNNFKSDFYNVISNLCFKYRNKPLSRTDIEDAYDWFDVHFYEGDDNYGVEESLKEAVGQEEVDRLYDYVSDYIYHYYDEIIKNMSQEEIDQFISDLSSTMKDYASHWQEENESLKESLTTKDREEAIEYIDDFLSKYDFYSELDAEDAKYICSSLETIMLDHIFWLDKLRKENEEDEEDTLEEARSKKQKEEENTLWDRVYSELASGKDTAVEGPHKIKAGKSDRYRYDDQIFIPSDGIGVHVETKDDLKFAKKVADHFGLEFKSYSEPCNQGTKTAWAGVIIIPEDMYEETPEETKERLAKK